MFSFSPHRTVVECGASHVAGGSFSLGKGRVHLERFACEQFVIAPGREAEWPAAIAGALAAVAARLPARGPVTLVLPGHLVLTKLIKTPRVAAEKREKIIRFEAQQNIPFALNDVVWAHAVVGESDSGLDVMLCAAKREAVDALCAAAEAAGLSPCGLMPGVLALQGLVASLPRDQPILYAHLGARSTTLLLLEDRRWQARTLSLGGNYLTQQLARNLDCDFAAAEALKTSGRTDPVFTAAGEDFATRLSHEITRTTLHFQRQAGAAGAARLRLVGGAARLPRLADMLTARCHIPVETFDPCQGLALSRAAEHAGAAAQSPHLADLVGAAKQLLASAAPPLDLLPPRRRASEYRRRHQPWLAVAAVLAAAALLPPLSFYREWESALRRESAALDDEIAPLRRREAAARDSLGQLDALRQRIAVLHDTVSRRASWQQLCADLQDRLVRVEDVWLERIQVAVGPTEADAPLRIAITGRMLDRTDPRAHASDDLSRKVNDLFASVADSPYVSAVENEHFDDTQPGILRFDFTLVAAPTKPL